MSSAVLLSLLSLVILCVSAAKECKGDEYAYNPYSHSCYRLVDEKKDWQSARARCQEDGEDLATLESVDSIQWFRNLRQTNEDWKDGDVWLGAQNRDGSWQWVDAKEESKPLLVADWEIKQPDGGAGKKSYCLLMHDGSRFGKGIGAEVYRWNDWKCKAKNPFVCENILVRPPQGGDGGSGGDGGYGDGSNGYNRNNGYDGKKNDYYGTNNNNKPKY